MYDITERKGSKSKPEGAETGTNAQEGSRVHLVGLESRNLLQTSSVRPNAHLGFLLYVSR